MKTPRNQATTLGDRGDGCPTVAKISKALRAVQADRRRPHEPNRDSRPQRYCQIFKAGKGDKALTTKVLVRDDLEDESSDAAGAYVKLNTIPGVEFSVVIDRSGVRRLSRSDIEAHPHLNGGRNVKPVPKGVANATREEGRLVPSDHIKNGGSLKRKNS